MDLGLFKKFQLVTKRLFCKSSTGEATLRLPLLVENLGSAPPVLSKRRTVADTALQECSRKSYQNNVRFNVGLRWNSDSKFYTRIFLPNLFSELVIAAKQRRFSNQGFSALRWIALPD